MSSQLHALLKLGLAAGLLLASVASANAADPRDPAPSLDDRLQDQLGKTDFGSAGRPRQPYLVVLVDVTKDAAVARDSGYELILGQPKSNSATADLLVQSIAGGTVLASYHVADPRFFKREDRARNVSRTAVMRVFVPLAADIDVVSITPVPGREATVSAGGTFDPRPLMDRACAELSPDVRDSLFPGCLERSAAVTPRNTAADGTSNTLQAPLDALENARSKDP